MIDSASGSVMSLRVTIRFTSSSNPESTSRSPLPPTIASSNALLKVSPRSFATLLTSSALVAMSPFRAVELVLRLKDRARVGVPIDRACLQQLVQPRKFAVQDFGRRACRVEDALAFFHRRLLLARRRGGAEHAACKLNLFGARALQHQPMDGHLLVREPELVALGHQRGDGPLNVFLCLQAGELGEVVTIDGQLLSRRAQAFQLEHLLECVVLTEQGQLALDIGKGTAEFIDFSLRGLGALRRLDRTIESEFGAAEGLHRAATSRKFSGTLR